ncbi:MAG TPA: carboxypeptidase-like regulatory domain-containing protein [Acidobacteriota bacterium]|nr:carboxypeptidase-like regulatory domain-containing protein [Acidobacteriota bacterium]
MYRIMSAILLLLVVHGSALLHPLQADDPGTGIIAGRVTDAQDRPIAGIRVLLLRGTVSRGYDPGKTRVQVSDLEGRYEFRNVLAGDYLVAAQPELQNDPSGRITLFYFPESMSGKQAYTLRVGPDSVLTAIDIRCIPEKLGFEARGRVVESVSGKPVTNMRLIYGRTDGFVRQDVQTDQYGSFVIARLDPGRYWVSISHAQSEDYYSYPAYFEIVSDDVSELQISASKGVSLRGKVILNKGIPETLFGDLNVVFHPNGISEVGRHPSNFLIDNHLRKSVPVSVDGNFVIKGLPPLIGRLSLQRRVGLPLENHYIRIKQNGLNISDALRLRDDDVESVTIEVTAGNARIQGNVKAVNWIVDLQRISVLIALQDATVASFARKMQPDEYGRFAFDGLLPGEYSIMAVITLANGLSRRSGDVYTVRVREEETREIELLLAKETGQ